jgi:hypothetical protein
MNNNEHRSPIDRVRETIHELADPGPAGERDGEAQDDGPIYDGVHVGEEFGDKSRDRPTDAVDDTGMAIGMETIGYGTGPGESGAGVYRDLREIEHDAGT